MEDDSLPLSRNPGGAALRKPLCTRTDEQYDDCDVVPNVLTGDAARKAKIRMARNAIAGSLVSVAVQQGDEILALLPGTIIRLDGSDCVVATCASHLSFRTIKELQVTVMVEFMKGKVTYKAALLDADFSSNLAFIKFTSRGQQTVAPVAKKFGVMAVAVGCTRRGRGLHDWDFNYCLAWTGLNEILNKQSDARTSGQVIWASPQGSGSVLGGPLVDQFLGVIGVVHYEGVRHIKAMPIDEVLKCLERLEKYGKWQREEGGPSFESESKQARLDEEREQDPESVASA